MSLRICNLTKGTVLAEAAEVAETSRQRRTGLLRYDNLARGQGLWIVPCEAIHTFGMKFAIDVIFLSRKRIVLKTREKMVRNRVAACWTAHSVLELPAGMIEAAATSPGDQLEFVSS